MFLLEINVKHDKVWKKSTTNTRYLSTIHIILHLLYINIKDLRHMHEKLTIELKKS